MVTQQLQSILLLAVMLISRSRSAAAFSLQRFHSSSLKQSSLTASSRIPPFLLSSPSATRCFGTAAGPDGDGDKRKQRPKSNKFKVNPNITQANMDKLAQAFDSTMAHYADDATFEDDFEDDDFDGDDDDDDDDIVPDPDVDLLDSDSFDITDFMEGEESADDPDFLDFGSSSDGNDMEARIAAAQNDMDLGQLSIPKDLDKYASDISPKNLRQLGFRPELNPFGNDESPRREQFKLVTDATICSACGADFQSHNEQRPGYLPPEKHEVQVQLGKIEDVQRLQNKAETAEWTPDDEINWLLQTGSGGGATEADRDTELDVDAMARDMGLDLVELAQKTVICKRCHGLQNFGKVDDQLRPGWTKEPLLSQAKFRELLRPIRDKPAVIVALVDIFDFSGSVLPELDSIAGDNPVIIAANKADLLTSKMGPQRVENWVRRELEYLGITSLANVGGAVRLVSCKTGIGVDSLLAKARGLADKMDCDVYIVGAANAGKSSLLNNILTRNEAKAPGKRRAGNANGNKGAVTTSPLPGTTLKFIKVDLGGGRNLYDTPGLLVPGTVTQLLTPDELKMVVPKK
jgi:hypothetical protein